MVLSRVLLPEPLPPMMPVKTPPEVEREVLEDSVSGVADGDVTNGDFGSRDRGDGHRGLHSGGYGSRPEVGGR